MGIYIFLFFLIVIGSICWRLFLRPSKPTKHLPNKPSIPKKNKSASPLSRSPQVDRSSPPIQTVKSRKSLPKEVKKPRSSLSRAIPRKISSSTRSRPSIGRLPQRYKRSRPRRRYVKGLVTSYKHKQNIENSAAVLDSIRRTEFEKGKELPAILGILRREISPYEFEEIILHCFGSMGYRVNRNSSYSNDGGIDGSVEKDGKLYLIQAKQYTDAIQASHIQDFAQVIKEKNAIGGFFVHTGKTKKKAQYVLRENSSITLISGQKLVRLVKGKISRFL